GDFGACKGCIAIGAFNADGQRAGEAGVRLSEERQAVGAFWFHRNAPVTSVGNPNRRLGTGGRGVELEANVQELVQWGVRVENHRGATNYGPVLGPGVGPEGDRKIFSCLISLG